MPALRSDLGPEVQGEAGRVPTMQELPLGQPRWSSRPPTDTQGGDAVKPGLPQHRKVKRLKRLMEGAPVHVVVGILVTLWERVASDSPSGILTGWTDDDIADAVEWRGPVEHLIGPLAEAGWLDRGRDGWLIHDWPEECPRYVAQRWMRELNSSEPEARAHMRSLHDAAAAGDRSAAAGDRSADAGDRSADDHDPLTAASVLYGPALIGPVLEQIPSEPAENSRASTETATDPPTPEPDSPASDPRKPSEAFLSAWAAYPHFPARSARGEAWKVWKAKSLERRAGNVMAWIAYSAASEQWQRERGQYVPAMERWLPKQDFSEPPPTILKNVPVERPKVLTMRRGE